MHRSRVSERSVLVAVLVTLFAAAGAPATDWPQFRGADGTAVTAETGLLRSWGEEGPRIVWKQDAGEGYSGIAAVGGRLYTEGQSGGEQRLLALDAATGKTLWSTSFGSGFESDLGNGPRSTPTVDGDLVFAASADSRLLAVAVQDGRVLWSHDFVTDFGAKSPRFGYGMSPFVDGDVLIVEVGGTEDRSIVAFDKRTGEVRWSSLADPAGYATPIAVELGGRRQYVFNRRTGLVGLAADSGELLWQHPSAMDTIVMPIFVTPDKLFISAAATGDGGHMIRVRKGEDGFTAEKVWSNPRMRNHFNTSVLVDGYLYGFDNATFRCVNASDGELVWAHRGYGKGSVVSADGLLFVLSDKGLVALAEATPAEFRELGRAQVMEGRSWTPPTLANGRLYVRDFDEIASIDVRGDGAAAPARTVAAAAKPAVPAAVPKTAAEVVARYTEARGGLERWRRLRSIEMNGVYATFSQEAPFTLRQSRGGFYRFDFTTLGGKATWARDAGGLWWVFPLLGIQEPARLTEEVADKYAPLLERRAMFEPPLLGYEEKGVAVELLGPGKINDRPTVDLKVTLQGERVETWHLDPATWLEVAVDSEVYDYSQGPAVFTERAFYSDFRDIGGVVLPYQVALEFGARLEEMTVESVKLDAPIDESVYAFPGAEK